MRVDVLVILIRSRVLLKSLKSLSLSEKCSSPESFHTSPNTSWAVSYLSIFKIEQKFYFALPATCFWKQYGGRRTKVFCMIYKPALLNVGLGTSSYQCTKFFWAWEARLYYISSDGDLTVTLKFLTYWVHHAGRRIASCVTYSVRHTGSNY